MIIGYVVKGFNSNTREWETLEYEYEGVTRTVYPIEYMANEAAAAYSDIWPSKGGYIVAPVGVIHV